MAVYRNVHTSFWQDDFVLSLDPQEKYFYLYLITGSKTSLSGIYEMSPRLVAFETGMSVEEVENLLDKFEAYGKIKRSETTNEICIVNWLRYNSSKSPKLKKAIEDSLEKVKDRVLIGYLADVDTLNIPYAYGIDTVSADENNENIPYAYPMDTVSPVSVSESESVSVSVSVSETESESISVSEMSSESEKANGEKTDTVSADDDDDDDKREKEIKELLDVYQTLICIKGEKVPKSAEEGIANFLREGAEPDMIRAAIELSAAYGARNWLYINKTIKEKLQRGINTFDGFRTDQERFEEQKRKTGSVMAVKKSKFNNYDDTNEISDAAWDSLEKYGGIDP